MRGCCVATGDLLSVSTHFPPAFCCGTAGTSRHSFGDALVFGAFNGKLSRNIDFGGTT